MTGAAAAAEQAITEALADPARDVSKVDFEIAGPEGVQSVYKSSETDDVVIWGPASVEVVDRENDRIKAKALKDALPQLLKRSTLSYEHTDQIVGEILTKYETDEPATVEINGKEITRKSFPTDVLDLEGMEPAMYVAGKVYGDTNRAREVREDIDKGAIRSYSISGEAIMSEMAVENGEPVTDILKMDLSAVTLCRQGMNQKAKFGLVSKAYDPSLGSEGDAVDAARVAVDKHIPTMANENPETEELTKAFADVLDERLPDGDLATIDDVETAVDARMEKGDDPADPPDDESEDNEETPEGPEGPEVVDVESEEDVEKSFASKLKSALPDDQWDAIAPIVKDCMGDDDDLDVVEPEDEVDPEEEEPSLDDLDVKSIGELEGDDAATVAKALLEKAGGETPASGSAPGETEPAHGGSGIRTEDDILKAAESITADPVAASMMDEDGNYRI